jgi:hypothetical protein
MRTYEILENGSIFTVIRARSAESAIRTARRAATIYASDYNCMRGEIIELEWTASATDDRYDSGTEAATMTFRARAK